MNTIFRKATVILSLGIVLLSGSCANFSREGTSRPGQSKQDNAVPPPLSEAEKNLLQKLGGELLPDGNISIEGITIHRSEREISFTGLINMTSGKLDVLIALPNGRLHESLIVSKIDPLKLQIALLLIGARNGRRNAGDEKIPQGTLFNIDIQPENGKRMPVEDILIEDNTAKKMDRLGWVFVGSSFGSNMYCLAKEEGNVVTIYSSGNTILDNPGSSGNGAWGLSIITENCPKYNSPVTVFLSFRNPGK